MSDEIKPCAHCGGTADSDRARGFINYEGKQSNAVAIYCLDCSIEVSLCYGDFPDHTVDELYAECLRIWNRRATVSRETAQMLADAIKNSITIIEDKESSAMDLEIGTTSHKSVKKWLNQALSRYEQETGGQG